MPTDIENGPATAVSFALRGVAWSLGFFGFFRLSWTEAHLLMPLTRTQAAVAVEFFGTPALPVEVTLACSGADALALCVGAVLAYPAKWRTRLAGASVGFVLIVCLNTVRIGALGTVVATPARFDALHLYLWPALITLAIAGYVFAWMRYADREYLQAEPGVARDLSPSGRPTRMRRFVVLAGAFLVVFVAASPLYLESAGVLALAGLIARAAAAILTVVGVSAHAAANVLWTPRGAFLVTQECIATPVLPIYLAAVCSQSTTWRRMTLGLLATAPLFIALGIMRLLIVAIPAAVLASPLFLVHAFYQLLLGGVVVFLAAQWRHGGRAAPRRALIGVIAGVAFVYLLGPLYTRIVSYPTGTAVDDPQGAIALLPAFQIGLYLALWIAAFVAAGWRRFVAGLAVLELTQAAGLLALHTLAHSGVAAHVRDIRAWAVAGPVLILVAVVNVARPRH